MTTAAELASLADDFDDMDIDQDTDQQEEDGAFLDDRTRLAPGGIRREFGTQMVENTGTRDDEIEDDNDPVASLDGEDIWVGQKDDDSEGSVDLTMDLDNLESEEEEDVVASAPASTAVSVETDPDDDFDAFDEDEEPVAKARSSLIKSRGVARPRGSIVRATPAIRPSMTRAAPKPLITAKITNGTPTRAIKKPSPGGTSMLIPPNSLRVKPSGPPLIAKTSPVKKPSPVKLAPRPSPVKRISPSKLTSRGKAVPVDDPMDDESSDGGAFDLDDDDDEVADYRMGMLYVNNKPVYVQGAVDSNGRPLAKSQGRRNGRIVYTWVDEDDNEVYYYIEDDGTQITIDAPKAIRSKRADAKNPLNAVVSLLSRDSLILPLETMMMIDRDETLGEFRDRVNLMKRISALKLTPTLTGMSKVVLANKIMNLSKYQYGYDDIDVEKYVVSQL